MDAETVKTTFYIVTSLINCGRFLSISKASHGHCPVRLLTLCSVGPEKEIDGGLSQHVLMDYGEKDMPDILKMGVIMCRKSNTTIYCFSFFRNW